jgi:hypothetical protein
MKIPTLDTLFHKILCCHCDTLYPKHPLLPAMTAPRQQRKIGITAEGKFIWETKLCAVIILVAVSDTEIFTHWSGNERAVELKGLFRRLIR